MLEKLYIKNYAIIDHLEINFKDGMTAVTGETGAGKSIIIGAIQLALGAKADSKSFRNNAEKCIIELQLNASEIIQTQLSKHIELDDYNHIIIRREINPNGKSRTFLNDSPSTLSDIQLVASYMVTIHQQFDQLDILESSKQMEVLDLYSNNSNEILQYENLFNDYRKKQRELVQLENENKKNILEQEYLQFQYTELDKSSIIVGEYAESETLLKTASKAEEIKSKTEHALAILQEDRGVIEGIQEILQNLKTIRINPAIEDVYNRLDTSRLELKDISNVIENIQEDLDFDPHKLSALQSKIDHYNRLFKKHAAKDDAELLEIKNDIEKKLNNISHSTEIVEKIHQEITKLETQLNKQSLILRNNRLKHIPTLKKIMESHLHSLGMEHACFEIQITEINTLTKNGKDDIKFLFTANKGSGPKPLQNHASGGELSRLNLAIKAIVADKSDLPTMIFDEIDTGVSGQVALQMGNILKSCSRGHQLLTITHSPQVASRADQHLYVYKNNDNNQTTTQVKYLNLIEKQTEIAKMLSGENPSKAALQNAKDLMNL